MLQSQVQPGQVYGDFEVISRKDKLHNTLYWLCRCKSGHEIVMSRHSLKTPGNSTSRLFCRRCIDDLHNNGLKKCCQCYEIKPLDMFYNCKGRIKGVMPHCKECRFKYDHTPEGLILRKKRGERNRRRTK